MQRLPRLTLFCLIVLLSTSSLARAQRPGGGGRFGGGMGGDLLGLLSQKSVQDELKLSDDQRKQGNELAEKQRDGFRGLRDLSEDERRKKIEERAAENQKAVAGVLNAEQLKRLKQISLQQQGVLAYEQPEVASALQLTNDQKDKLKGIQQSARDKMREAFQGGGQPDREKLQAARKAIADQAAGVLTDEQKAKWKDLTGETFTGEIVRPTGGGNGGGGRRRPNGT
jgi:Spy/CpxP family protein refolding chaperone